MNKLLVSTSVGALLALGACCPAKPAPPDEPAPASAPTSASPAAKTPAPAPAKTKTVVVFVVDQFGSWVLEKYLPHLPKDGAIRRGVDSGVRADVVYAFASTRTAPGHAAIMTGKPPAVTGITSNRITLPGGEHTSIVSDGKHGVLGREDAYASPAALRAPTVGDALHDATSGAAKIVTVSGKDRAAVISGGQHADLAVWYDYHVPGFTTSTFYTEAMPARLAQWLDGHPVKGLLKPWKAEQPDLYQKILGPDDGAGEGDWFGLGTVFPHDLAKADKPYSVLRATAPLTEYMLDLATVVADQTEIGRDDVMDLFVVSVSGTDYTGHSLGPESWEYLDHLIRADRAMGKLVRHLEKRGPVSVLITSDHGVAPLPEKNPKGGGRIFPDAIEQVAQAAAEEVLGEGEWVDTFSAPFLYLKSGLEDDQRDKAIAAIGKALAGIDSVGGAYDLREVKKWRNAPDRVKRAVGLSVADDTRGALYVFASKYNVIDEDRPRGKGTTHGTPWGYDTHVPVIFWGRDVKKQRLTEPLPQERVAPTISKLLGVPPPKGVTAPALPGFGDAK
jgi:hypothetical protein